MGKYDLTILCVEDDRDSLVLIEYLCKRIFKRVLGAENSSRAIEIFNSYSGDIDIVISDLNLPDIDGLTLLSKLKELNSDLETVILTAFDEPKYFIKAIEVGVSKYLLKPIDREVAIESLESMAKNLLDRAELKSLKSKELELKINYSSYRTMQEIIDAQPNPTILTSENSVKFVNRKFKEVFDRDLIDRVFFSGDKILNNSKVTLKDRHSKERIFLFMKQNLDMTDIDTSTKRYTLYTLNEITTFENQRVKISKLNEIGKSLTSQKSLYKLLETILTYARELTDADGGTLYLKEKSKLKFEVIQNDTLNINKLFEKFDTKELYLYDSSGVPNREMIAPLSVLQKKLINIKDIYESEKFNFEATKRFDKSMGYSTKSMLVIPMVDHSKDIVGVLQLVNKKSENGEFIEFDRDDEQIIESLSSQAAIVISRAKQEKLLIRQSKMASLGEMIDSIAHQWRQPLTILSLYSQEIPFKVEMGDISLDEAKDLSNRMLEQIRHMNDTLNKFRSFFRPNKEREEFSVLNTIESTLTLIKDEFMKKSIQISITGDRESKVIGFENEYKHILLNILNNAKDALEENNPKDSREIEIAIEDRVTTTALFIKDNAGGIPKDIIPYIFDANFTTKADGKGTGIGLYMSKLIVENMGGFIEVKNSDRGAEFMVIVSSI